MFGIFLLINKISLFLEWNVIIINRVNINIFIFIDWISLIFIFTIFLISSIIIFYRYEYINLDNYNIRFFYLLIIFIISIILIILSPRIIRILIGWDGLGLISYCLVIYYQNIYRYNSGILTVLLNRIGDIIIIIVIRFIFNFGSWNFINFNNLHLIIIIFLIISSFTKRAQFPFSSWLPIAIAAPTPVSSLVHSSTLVTAGIYLLIRFNYLIYNYNNLLNFIIFIGLITILIAGFSANFEYDLKKIIAFSTLSQLGLIIIIFSLKFYILCYFHLIIHAIFKSIIFICSGIIIHSILNYQDIRYLRKIKEYIPLTRIIIIISNFSLCGLPFISGFYSKDKIIEIFFINNFSLVLYLFLILSTRITLLYSLRLIYYLIINNINFFSLYKIIDIKLINFSILILFFISIFFGNLLNWLIFNNIELIFLINFEKIIIILILIISLFIFLNLYKLNLFFYKNNFFYFFGKIYYYYNLNIIILIKFFFFRKFYFKLFDKGWREYFFKKIIYLNINNLNKLNLNNNFIIFILYIISFIILFIIF